MLQSLVNELHKALPGYHLEVSIFPSGGNIDADACEECGTLLSASAGWRYKKGRTNSLDGAVKTLRLELGIDVTP